MKFMDQGAIGESQYDVTVVSEIQNETWQAPNAQFLFQGDYAKQGSDLVISLDGKILLFKDYFSTLDPADIAAPNGAVMRGANVARLAGAGEDSRTALLHVQNDGADTQTVSLSTDAIGQVDTVNGSAVVTRADGTVVNLSQGELVYQNDVVQTESGSTLSLVFLDGTIFTLAQNSRMILDELIYDPDGTENAGVFNLIQGGFVFVAGQVAKTGGMEVNTPTSTIGIRGTTVEVQIVVNDQGITEVIVSLLPDWPDGAVGRIDIFDVNGQFITTLTDVDTAWVISPIDGETRAIPRAEAIQESSEELRTLSDDVTGRAELRVEQGGEYVIFDSVDGRGDGGDAAAPGAQDAGPDPDAPDQGGTGQQLQQDGPGDDVDEGDDAQDGQDAAPGDSQDTGTLEDDDTSGGGQDAAPNDGSGSGDAAPGDAAPDDPAEGDGGTEDDARLTPTLGDSETQEATNTQQGEQNAQTSQFASAETLSDAELAGITNFAADPATGFESALSVAAPALGDGAATPAALSLGGDPGLGATSVIDPFGGSTFGDTGSGDTTGETFAPTQFASTTLPAQSTPIADDVSVTATEDQAFTFDILSSASDPNGGTLSLVSLGAPANGTVSVNAAGQVEYTPFANFAGTDTFTYTVENEQGNTTTAAITVTVAPVNDAPITTDDAALTPQQTDIVINVLSNDVDIDTAAENWTIALQSAPANGTAEVQGTQILYTPNLGFNGVETFTYSLSDGSTTAATLGTVSVTVNDPPTTAPDAGALAEDGTTVIDVLGNDTDTEGDAFAISLVSNPTNGTASITGGQIAYTPDPNFNGTDSFTYTVTDGNGATSTASVDVTVTAVNDTPVAADTTVAVTEDGAQIVVPLATASDVDGDALTLQSFTAPTNGTLVQTGNQLTYTPDADFFGTDSFTYTVVDPSGAQDTGQIDIQVAGVNDVPVAGDLGGVLTNEDSSVTIDLAALVADVDGDTLSITPGAAANGTVAFDGTVYVYTPNPNFFGTDSFTYSADDGAGGTAEGTVSITIDAVNDTPVAAHLTAIPANEDTAITIDLAALASDVDGDATTITTGPAANGTVAFDGTTYTYTPNADFFGTDSFTYTVTDPSGAQDTGLIEIAVAGVNDAPVAIDLGGVQVDEDSATTLDLAALVTDVDGNAVTITAGPAANGTVTFNGTAFVYTPDADFNGTDSFTYTADDGAGGTADGTVSITIDAINDAPVSADDAQVLFEDGSLNFAVTANDSDVDGDALTVQSVTQPQNGAVVLETDGTLTYTPATDYTGSDSFTYTVSDGNGGTDTGTVTLTVEPVNDAPVATDDDGVTTTEDTPVTFDVRGNDSDTDGDPLIVQSVTAPANGAVVIEANGTLTYTSDADFNGTDSFDYTITDGVDTGTATVTVTVAPVNDAPIVTDDSGFTTDFNTVLEIPASTLLSNDDDGDPEIAQVLSVTGVTDGTGGTVVLDGGLVIFTPDDGHEGAANFTYEITDEAGANATGQVSLTVGANSPPEATDDSVTLAEDGSATLDLLGNDSDPDGQVLTVTPGTASNGTITFDGTNYVYTPDADFNGADSFTYAINDGYGGTDSATVNITVTPVNDAPVGTDDGGLTTPFDTAIQIDATDLLLNDTDLDGDTLTVIGVSNPSNGTVALAGGTITFTPDAGFFGAAGFDYDISDGAGGTTTASVTISVGGNQAPVAGDDTATTDEDNSVIVDILANDEDPDLDSLAVTLGAPDNGTFAFDGTNYVYTPNANFNGTDSLTYAVDDGNGGQDTATVTITVNSVNDAPLAFGDPNVTTDEDNAILIDVLGNDVDIDGDTLTVQSTTQPANGAVVTQNNGQLTYIPNANFSGVDTFTYTIDDGNGGQDTATVTVTVNAVNDAPVAFDDPNVTTDEDTAVLIDVLGNDTDIDGDTLTVESVTQPTNGVVEVGRGGELTYTPDANFNGVDTFTYTNDDSNGGQDTATVTVTVNAVNDAPVAAADTFATDEDTAVVANVLSDNGAGADFDPEGGALTLVSATTLDGSNISLAGNTVFLTSGATINITDDGAFNYTPGGFFNQITTLEELGDGETASDGFTYVIADAAGAQATGTVSFNVTGINDAPVTAIGQYNPNEDGTVSGNALTDETAGSADFDPEGDAFEITAIDGIALADADEDATTAGVQFTVDDGGQLTIFTDGTFTFDTAGAYEQLGDGAGQLVARLQSVQYTVTDVNGASSTESLRFFVGGVNDAPVAADDDAGATLEDTPIAINVLSNDTDVEGDTLSVLSATQPTNGTVVVNGDGTITYAPDANFNGDDSFTYTVTDGLGLNDTATVTLTVSPVADSVTIDAVTGDDVLDIVEQVDVIQITGTADPDGSVLISLGDAIVFANTNTDGTFAAFINPDSVIGQGTATLTIDATDAQGNPSGSAQRSLVIEDIGGTTTVTVAGSVTNYDDPGQPFDLNVSDMPFVAIYDLSSGAPVARTPTASSTEVRFTADDGRTFAFTGTDLDYDAGTGLVTGVQIGTTTDPDFYTAINLPIPMATVVQTIADTIAGGTIDETPFFSVFAQFALIFNGSEEDDWLGYTDIAPQNDVLNGNGGNDELNAGLGDDTINGGEGSDFIFDAFGNNTLDGGTGIDTVSYRNATGGVNVDLTTGTATKSDGAFDALSNFELVRGSLFNDTIRLPDSDGFNRVRGLQGDDALTGGTLGNDFVSYSRDSRYTANTSGVVINLALGFAIDLFGDFDTLSGFEGAEGTEFNDEITASDTGSFLLGNEGDDILIGGAGNDEFSTGDGEDIVVFGAGDDTVNDLQMLGAGNGGDTLVLTGFADANFSSLMLSTFNVNGFSGTQLTFTDGAETATLSLLDVTIEQVEDYLGFPRFVGTDGDDVVQVTPEQGQAIQLIGSAGNDTYNFANIPGQTYSEITYEFQDVNGITATLDANAATSTVDKGDAGTDTLQNIGQAANWAFAVGGTTGDDVFNITHNTTGGFAWIGAWSKGGNDTINLFGGNGALAVEAPDTGENADVDLLNGTITAGAESVTIVAQGDISDIDYWIYTQNNGDDTVRGSNNDDTFILGAGTDIADGRNGFDAIRFNRDEIDSGVTANLGTGTASGTWNGEAFNYTLSNFERARGSSNDDSLTAGTGNHRLDGNDGNDTLIGGAGNNGLYGGAGNDLIDASAGTVDTEGFGDWVNPGTGSDTVIGNQGLWEAGNGIELSYQDETNTGGLIVTVGQNGSGTVESNTADVINDTFTYANFVRGTNEGDRFVGGDNYGGVNVQFIFQGLDGNDTLIGGGGNENLNAGDGDDLIDASGGTIDQQTFGDFIQPGRGTDTIIGHQGLYESGGGVDISYGNLSDVGGILLNVGDNGTGTVVSNIAGLVNDNFTWVHWFNGTSQNDRFESTTDDGNSQGWRPYGGDDIINAGPGYDHLLYDFADDFGGVIGGITVDFASGTVLDPYGDTDTFTGIEEVRGTDDADSFTGDDNGQRLRGRGGDDTLAGGGGDDNYDLGDGSDLLIFSNGFDFVGDFNVIEDTLNFAGLALQQIGTLDINTWDNGLGINVNFDDDFDSRHDTNLSLSIEGIAVDEFYNLLLDPLVFTSVNATGTNLSDVFWGSPEDDTADLGSNDGDGDQINLSAGNDTYELGGADSDSFYSIETFTLGEVGLTVDLDFNLTSGTIDKGSAGLDTINNALAAMQGFGLGLGDGDGDDVFNITLSNTEVGAGFLSYNQRQGNDTINLDLGDGLFRISVDFEDSGVSANLSTGDIMNNSGSTIDLNISGASPFFQRLELRTNNGNDTVIGSDLDNLFILGAGTDTVDGLLGNDWVRYDRNGVDNGVSIDLAAGKATGIWDELSFDHTLTSIESARGSNFDDAIFAIGTGSILDGRGGNDILIGAAGDDDLRARDGNDILSGLGGDDVYNLSTGAETVIFSGGFDFVNGFDPLNDSLQWSGSALTNLGTLTLNDNGDHVFFSFTDGGAGLGIGIGGITLAQAETIRDNATSQPQIQIGTTGRDDLIGTSGNDIINLLSNTGQGDIATATAGNDTYIFSQSGPSGWYGVSYTNILNASITSNIDLNNDASSVSKGIDGTDTLIDLQNAASSSFFILGSDTNDTHNITGHATDWYALEVGHENQTGEDIINYTPGVQGNLNLKMNAPENIVADFSGVDIGQAATVTASDGDSLTLNVLGPLNDTRLSVWLGNGNDTFIGNSGSNEVILGAGTDVADGGGGFDTIRYDRSEIVTGVVANLETGTATGVYDGQAFSHTLSNFERVRGSNSDDQLTAGNTGGDVLEGRDGNDVLNRADLGEGWTDGGSGRDTLLQNQSGSFDFSAINVRDSYQNVEVLSFENGGADTVALSLQNVLDFTQTADSLLQAAFGGGSEGIVTLHGETGDTVTFTHDNVQQVGTEADDGRAIDVYQFADGGGAILALIGVDQDMTVDVPANI